MSMKLYLQIFWSLFKTTLLGYGGGQAIVPIYEHEAVAVRQWMTKTEYGDALAFANTLPGPVATKMGTFVGFKAGGWIGAFVALFAVAVPTAVVLIILLSVLNHFKGSPVVAGMLRAIRPVIFVMLAMLAADFFKYAFGTAWVEFALAAAYFISVQYFKLNPSWGIVGALLIGAVALRPAP